MAKVKANERPKEKEDSLQNRSSTSSDLPRELPRVVPLPLWSSLRKGEGDHRDLRKAHEALQREAMRLDIVHCAPLSSSALPSCAFFTFLNSHLLVNCLATAAEPQRSDGVGGCQPIVRAGRLAAGCADSRIRLWYLHSSASSTAARAPPKRKADALDGGYANPSSSMPPGTSINSSMDDEADAMGREVRLVGHSGPVYGLSFSPCGRFLLSCSRDASVRLWSVDRELNSALVVYRAHCGPVWDVQFSPLGFYFASAGQDGTARVWTTDKITPVRLFAGHTASVNCVTFHPNCSYVMTGSADHTARLWAVASGLCVRVFTGHSEAINCVAISPDGRLAASGGDDRRVIVWDLERGQAVKVLTGHMGRVVSLSFSAEGALLASGGLDATVALWSIPAGSAAAAALSGHVPVEGVARAEGSGERVLEPTHLQTLYTKNTPVSMVKFTPRNLLMAAGVYVAPV
jgi:transcription initiation factor TFIID subunit 5